MEKYKHPAPGVRDVATHVAGGLHDQRLTRQQRSEGCPARHRPAWISRAEFVRGVVDHQADPALRRELRDLAPGSTDDLDARERRLATLTHALAMEPVPVDDEVAQAWAKLRVVLRNNGQRMPLNDSWIAATAWSRHLPVVTQDPDYIEIPGLDVIKV